MVPSLGYYPNAKKCWLVTKPEKENEGMEVFSDKAIKILTQGQKHLGAVLSSRTYLEEYMRGKVEDWVEQVENSQNLLQQIHKPHMQPLQLD